MSSTYAHYQGPSSLPSDYAILSRLGGSNYESSTLESQPANALQTPRRVTRRESFPIMIEHYYRPLNPTIGVSPHNEASRYFTSPPTETSPLLNVPPIPRIEENVNGDASGDNTSNVTMFWEELAILTKYALPVFGTHVLEHSLVIVSVISIGHISTTALAAISLGSMTASVSGYSVIQGFSSALDTILPSAWTSNQPQLVGLWAQRMTVMLFVSLIPTVLIWLNAESILIFLKQDPEVAYLAAIYLRWASLGLPAYAFNCISRRYFQSQGLFTVPTRIVFITAPINALLNWLLVWGPSPIRLGFIGAPIATTISFNLISIMSICYGIFFTPKTAWYPLSPRMFKGFGVLVPLGLGGVGQTASEWWAWELVALAASLLGPTALAAQSVLLVSASSTFQAPFALSVATSVRIGNLLGEKNAKRAGVTSNTSITMAFLIGCVWSTMFFVFRHSWAYLFNSDPEVVKLVTSTLPILGLFQVFEGWSAVTAGILRAKGKQLLGAWLNLSAYYVLGVPLGLYLTFTWHLGIHGLWYGLTFSLVYCSIIGSWICFRTDWDKEVVKVMQRLKAEEQMRKELEEGEGLLPG